MALVDQIIGVESGGNATAKNPNSSATGSGQFISATWLDMMGRHRPDLVEGKSKEEVLALRNDPALSRQMTEAYAAQNGATLSKAGLPVTPGTQYLAHFAGPQGAVSVLQADPNAPVASVLGQGAVKANPFLQGMTVGQLQAWADKKMGGSKAAPASPASPIMAPVAAPNQQVPQQPYSLPPQASNTPPVPSAPAQSGGGGIFAQMPAEQMAPMPPMFAQQRKPIDLSRLKAALAASRGPIFGQG